MMEVDLNQVGGEGGSFVAQTKGERVELSINGFQFITEQGTLQRLPESRLASLTKEDPQFDHAKNYYFFERNPVFFPHILSAYKTGGSLHFSHELCTQAVFDEIKFWQIPLDLLSPCCWTRYQQLETDQKDQEAIAQSIKDRKSHRADEGKWTKIYWMLTDSTSCTRAKVWCGVYSVLAILSCLMLCVATLPANVGYRKGQSAEQPVFFAVNFLFFLFFIAEWCVRFTVCPTKLHFLRSVINMNDIITALLLLIIHLVGYVNPGTWQHDHWLGFVRGIITTLYMLRLVRSLTFLDHVPRVRVLTATLRSSVVDLLPIFIVVFASMLLVSTFVYYAETDERKTQFDSIPNAFWWAMVTLTTVGYGDIIPVGMLGKALGSFCLLAGMLLLVLPVPIYTRHFARHTRVAEMQSNLEQRDDPKPSPETIPKAPIEA